MGWDKNIDYDTYHNIILKHLQKIKSKKAKCYDSILLIQLRNGSRISEAIKAYKEFLKSKKSEVTVDVSKKRREEKRLMIIPKEVETCEDFLLVDDFKLNERIKFYIRHVYKINTHSLRYAFITKLLRQNISPSIIAKITKHSKLDYILTYTQEKIAEDVLRNSGQ